MTATPIAHDCPRHWLVPTATVDRWATRRAGQHRSATRSNPWQVRVARGMVWGMAWLLACTQAWPQAAPNTGTPAAPSIDQCKKDVFEFERAIGTVRQLQGNQAAADLKEKLLPAATERQLLTTEGYCGLAKHLHEKKLLR